MTNYSLISIDHVHQLIPAITAFRSYRQQQHSDQPVLIFIKPHIRFSLVEIDLLKSLLTQIGAYTLIYGSSLFNYLKIVMHVPVQTRAKLLRKKLKNYRIKEIFFAHDVSGDFWNQTLMQSFPKATRICYGDSLGLVYTYDYFNDLMFNLHANGRFSLYNFLVRMKRTFFYPNKNKRLFPDYAILTIPTDPANDYLPQCKLKIPTKSELQQCVFDLTNALPELKGYMDTLIDDSDEQSYLLTLSNFTESKLTTLENEIALYKEILTKNAAKHSTIIIKPHPVHSSTLLNKIIQSLEQDYRIKILDEAFFSLPIELFDTLIKNCIILSVSYSSISIPYIYDKKVIHVLSEDLIKKYFIGEKINWVISSNTLFLNIISALPHWDNKSALI